MRKIFLTGLLVSVLFALEGVLIPLYHYPSYNDTQIAQLIALKKRYPNAYIFVILNPDNGNVTKTLYNFAFAIKRLHEAHIHPLGYVHTRYGTRANSEVMENIRAWGRIYKKWGLEGIFLDEVNGTKEQRTYYEPLMKLIRDTIGYVVLNPGTAIDQNYASFADIIVTNESNSTHICDINGTKNAILLHSTPRFDANETLLRHYNYIYVTPHRMPNPWYTLSPFTEEILRRVAHGKKGVCFNNN